jgi:hypothetical protein
VRLTQRFLIDAELWRKTRAGARAGRGFRYQDAAAAWLATLAWQGDVVWTRLIPEGVDDIVLDGLDVEIRAQLKSKHDSQDVFSQAEVAKHLAKSVSDLPPNWREDSRLRLALVLERPLQGIQPSGWATALAETGQSLDSLRALLDDALGESSNEIVDAVLARTHLLVEPDPMEKGCAVLASFNNCVSSREKPLTLITLLQQRHPTRWIAVTFSSESTASKVSLIPPAILPTRLD